MTPRPLEPRAARLSEEMINAFFDRELGEGASDEFFSKLRSDLPRCAEVARTQRVISLLREPIESPDVADRVLAAVHRRRRFVPERIRRYVTAGRLAAAIVVLVSLLGVVLIDRVSPGALRLTPRHTPVSNVVSSTREAAHGVSELAGAVTTVRVLAGEPAATTGPSSARSRSFMDLRPGVTSAHVLTAPRAGSDDSLIVYRGAGPDTRVVLPELVYFDRNTAVVLPLGHISPSRIGSMDWAGVSSDNLFLLPVIEPAEVARPGVAAPSPVDKKPRDKR